MASLCQGSFSQDSRDTVISPVFVVIEDKIPFGYKTTELDSLAVQTTTTLSELLQEHSSVFIKSYGSATLSSVSFRGTGASHTKVLWNGISLNSPMNGQVDFSLFPTFFLTNVGLHHGASGLIDGNGALGGSILMDDIESYENKTSSKLRYSIGSFGNHNLGLNVSASNDDWHSSTKVYATVGENNFSYTNSFKANNPREEQENAAVEQAGFQQAIYKKWKKASIGARVWYFNSHRQLPSTMQTDGGDENQKDESVRALVEYKGLKNKLQYRLTSSLINDRLTYKNSSANILSNSNIYYNENKVDITFYLNDKYKLVNDLRIKNEYAKSDGFSESQQRLSTGWLLGMSRKGKQWNIDLFNRSISVGRNVNLIAPSIAMLYRPFVNKSWFLKSNAGINYNYPTFNDLYWNPGGNADLKPERAKMGEIGIRYTSFIAKIVTSIEVTYFYSHVDNWIIWQPTPYSYWSPSNLKEVINKGLEGALSLSTKINSIQFSSTLNYAYTASTNANAIDASDNALGKQLIYVPFHKSNFFLRGKYKTVEMGYSYSYVGRRYTSSDNNWYLPPNFVNNLYVSHERKIRNNFHVLFSFKVNNLFNQEYQSISWRPMVGRNYLLSASLNFN